MKKWGKTEEAVNKYREILANLSGNIRASLMLARLLIAENRVEEAVEVLQSARKRHPRNPDLVIYLAGAHEQSGREEEALRVLKSGLPRMPSSGRIHLNLGRILSRKPGRDREALSHLLQARNLLAKDFRTYLYLGDYYYRRNRMEKARREWESARSLRPQNPDIERRLRSLNK